MCVRAPSRSIAVIALLLLPLASGCGADGMGGGADTGADGGSLGTPTAAFPEDFGTIQTVRELPDGRVLVADPLGGALFVVDLDAGTRTRIGTEGEGPGEYRQPDAVWPLPGDSTLLIDLGNGRMTALGPDLDFGPTSQLSSGDPRTGLIVAIPQGVDGQGYVYARSMGGGPGGELPDSGAILRVERGTLELDTVAMYKLQARVVTTSGGPNNRGVSMSAIPLSAEDAWGVARDGSVVVARSSDYHVEWIDLDGHVSRGAPAPFDPVAIGTAEKQEWVDASGRSGGGLAVGVNVQNGVIQTSFRRGGGAGGPGGAREIDEYEWPETKPPFHGERLRIDPLQRVWVRRHMPAGADATYDLFDRDGEHVATFTLPNDRAVVDFGRESVYVVAYDDFDLNYLERYPLPGAPEARDALR